MGRVYSRVIGAYVADCNRWCRRPGDRRWAAPQKIGRREQRRRTRQRSKERRGRPPDDEEIDEEIDEEVDEMDDEENVLVAHSHKLGFLILDSPLALSLSLPRSPFLFTEPPI
jgi:hypothetical protein